MTNEKVRNRIQNATGVHDDLLTMVKKRKLRKLRSQNLKITGKDNSARDSERSKKERKTEEDMDIWNITARNGREWSLEIL